MSRWCSLLVYSEPMIDLELQFRLRSLSRLLYVITEEEDRFVLNLRDTVKQYADQTWVYSATYGLTPLAQYIRDWTSKQHAENTGTMSIHDALIHIYKADPKDKQHFYVITDPERWLADPHVVRRLLNIVHQGKQDNKTIKIIVFVGSRRVIPDKLSRYIEVLQDPGLTVEEITEKVTNASNVLSTPGVDHPETLFRGLTSYEIDRVLSQSVVRTRKSPQGPRIDPKMVSDFRRQQVQKTDLVQQVDTDLYPFSTVGGANRFKDWAEKTRASWTEKGRHFGLKAPKGVLCVGVWGCGKSLSVKALGNAWSLPVVQLEMGRLRSSGVGESEANVYRALRIVESVAPCVTGDTEITLADGSTTTIEELWQDPPEHLEVLCWNERTLRVDTTRVSLITRREAEAFQVTAANGFTLNATANHQHYVLRGGLPEWVRTDELSPGDMLAVPLYRHEGSEDCTSFHPRGMREYTRPDGTMELRRGGGGFRDAVITKLPLKWSTDLGWLLGVIEGDGFIGSSDSIGLTNTNEVLLTAFERILLEQFQLGSTRRQHMESTPDLPGLSANPVFKPCWTTTVANQLAAEFLRSARTSILTAPASVRAAFLAGWVDADGCIQPAKVSLTVKGPKLRDERRKLARQLVQSLGVVPSKFDTALFEITGERAVKLARLLGEFLVAKNAKATQVATSEMGFDRGMGFACGALLRRMRNDTDLRIAEIKPVLSTSVMWRHENGTTPVSERQMGKYIELFGDHATDLQRLLSADCRWVEIRDIQSVGEQPVYDLVCEGEDTHSFFANGLVTHNCLVWVDEAEKSLSGGPSSNQSDAGTTSRTIGILSTWLQETSAQVCLALTANSLKSLPIEFVNRMDERFFFTLPSEEERIDIMKIHIRKVGQNPDNFDLASLSELASGLVGREIEQAIGAGMVESFAANKDGLDEPILANEFRRRPRILKTMVDEVKELMEWVGYDPDCDDGIRARFASTPERKGGAMKVA